MWDSDNIAIVCGFHYQLSDTSKVWKNKGEQIHGVSPLRIDAAKRFINELTSAGGTNIYDSLTQVGKWEFMLKKILLFL